MGIPVLQELWDGLRWLIDLFLYRLPRPIQALIFLLFIVLLGGIISIFLHVAGFHCNTHNEIVKIDFFDLPTNLLILIDASTEVFDEDSYTVEEVHSYNTYVGVDCYYLLNNSGGDYDFCENISSPDCNAYYRNPDCFNCTTVNAGWEFEGNVPRYLGNVCADDAYRKEWSSYERYFKCEALCEIPLYYRFEYDNATYNCDNLNYCGINKTIEPKPKIDQLIKSAGGELVYLDNNKNSYKNVIYLKCNNNYNPRLTFFGLDILNYQYWILLFLLYIMVMFFIHVRNLQ